MNLVPQKYRKNNYVLEKMEEKRTSERVDISRTLDKERQLRKFETHSFIKGKADTGNQCKSCLKSRKIDRTRFRGDSKMTRFNKLQVTRKN